MSPRSEIHVHIASKPLEPAEALAFVSSPRSGGTALFSGTVRSPNAGEDVDHLVYEAWEERAEGVVAEIAEKALVDHDAHRAYVAHRTGRVEVGEPSVVVAVAAAHRDGAFGACREVIDALKASAPIWKKEITLAGENWVGMPAAGGGRP